jgi:hypothetical protein
MMLQSAAGKTATVEIAVVAVQKAGKESEAVGKAGEHSCHKIDA